MTERMLPIKILGHWQDARVHVTRGDLFIDIPAELIESVEADHPGVGAEFGYQLMLEWWRLNGLLPLRQRPGFGPLPQSGEEER
jgi:hypothetical protein